MSRVPLCALLLVCCTARAEQLPVKSYTTADGLARNIINRIVPDRRGFLWFATPEGLSQFDGYQFTNYGTAEGLPDAEVADLLVTRAGEYWVATRKGVARFEPQAAKSSRPRFTVYAPGDDAMERRVASLVEDKSGTIWCASYAGLYRLVRKGDGSVGFEFVDVGLSESALYPRVVAMLADRSGALWVATVIGLLRRGPDGRLDRFTTRQGLPEDIVTALIEDRQERLWAGTTSGLCRLPAAGVAAQVFTERDGLASNQVTALLETSDGNLWVGTKGGVSEFSGRRLLAYTTAHGLSHPEVNALAEDLEGNLWVGGASGGAVKLARGGFVSYSEADGLHRMRIASIFEARSGELVVVSGAEDGWWIHRFDGKRFHATRPNLPRDAYYGWSWSQHVVEDRAGEWWLPTGQGLWRFPRVSAIERLAVTTPKWWGVKDGLPGENVFRIFEDSRGDIWLVTFSREKTVLAKWERGAGRMVRYPEATGGATAFREDRAGHLWIGFFWGGLARYRDGRFTFFGAADGVPEGTIPDLHVDQAGRLWVASFRSGLARVDDPTSPRPRFQRLTTEQGLSSNAIRCITEDGWGRIYLGTGRGVDRLDPRSGRIRHYTTADGLARGEPAVAFRDRHGALWFGTLHGLSRLIPEPERLRQPPPVLLTSFQAGGAAFPASDLGETQFTIPELGPNRNHLPFGFVGLSYAPGEQLRYQYKLEGADRDWSAPTEQRRVLYAGLAPGSYRFWVRAINSDGTPSPQPAVVAFRVAPPVWRRWWFLANAVLASGVAVYGLHRLRVAQLVAVERVRTPIATDLHDDIGSGLARVGLMSELVLRQLEGGDRALAAPLQRIAALSRELGESMSDIVWSVNPGKDRLQDLTQRMRRYASEGFTARGIGFRFRAPGPEADRKLEPGVRRQVFLIFKEAVNNIIRHSGCTEAVIEFGVEEHQLVLQLRDNGRGLEAGEAGASVGLPTMRRRARDLGGELEVVSSPGQGVTITLKAPAGTLHRLMGARRRILS